MAYYINDKECIACGACAMKCPVGAVNEGDDIKIPKELWGVAAFLDTPIEEHNSYRIDQEKCTQCGACVEVCPTWAIENSEETAKNAKEFTDGK